jgi:hypothetical protein
LSRAKKKNELSFRSNKLSPERRAEVSFRHGEFVRVAGPPIGYTIEQNADASRIDHLTVLVRATGYGTAAITLNTLSIRNLRAGYDPRIRLGIFTGTWVVLPPAGITSSASLDYAIPERIQPIAYQEVERSMLENMLIERTSRAAFIEGWGEFYVRRHPGIHQVHSRRASCAVPADYVGHDGAIRFYFEKENLTELLLFKFCGQE